MSAVLPLTFTLSCPHAEHSVRLLFANSTEGCIPAHSLKLTRCFVFGADKWRLVNDRKIVRQA